MFHLHRICTVGGRGVIRRASKLTPTSTTNNHTLSSSCLMFNNIRTFSSSDNNDNNNNTKEEEDDHDQKFFLNNDESTLPHPPSYVRDSITGKWTDKTLAELSSADRKLLNLTDDMQNEELLSRLDERWKSAAEEGKDGELNKEHVRLAHRIQEEKLALGVIGRDSATTIPNRSDDDDGKDDTPPSTDKPLTSREFQALKTYAKKEYGIKESDFTKLSTDNDSGESLIPINDVASGSENISSSKQYFDADLDLAYLNPRLNKRAYNDDGVSGRDDPFADLLPSDLNPARKVNRKNAKPIPQRLLHHNNLSLLRRYTTPGGKIMNRVQSRLGAKDQRKIAKLVKRARHLGLIPHLGQWKYEDHGNLNEISSDNSMNYDDDEDEEGKKDWEVELEKRGLWPLQDETELVKKYYEMDKIMDHIAGPRRQGGVTEDGVVESTNKKREELESLLGGVGALVVDEKN